VKQTLLPDVSLLLLQGFTKVPFYPNAFSFSSPPPTQKTTMKSSNWLGFLLISLFVVIAMLPSSRSLSISPQNIVIVGGGIQGMSVAYHLAERIRNRVDEVSSSSSSSSSISATTTKTTTITILEANELASAASGKGGGFMARSWGDGTATQGLHELSFDRYEELCPKIGCRSYRKLPVLSVTPNQGRQNNNGGGGGGGISKGRKANYANLLPDWLDGDESIRMISPMGYGQDTAQVTPHDFVMKLWENISQSTNTVNEDNSSKPNNLSVRLVLGTCTGVETTTTTDTSQHKVLTGVKYRPKSSSNDNDNQQEECTLPADVVVISAGPWSCAAEDWFEGSISLPMEGIKSTSIVWKKPNDIDQVDATALFCGEDYQYGTHCKLHLQKSKQFIHWTSQSMSFLLSMLYNLL
jgi:glycine/D-amino acid oxidase-like deaminating enzyme